MAAMDISGSPPPGGGSGQGPGVVETTQHYISQVRPGQTFAGAAMAASGTVPGGRSWQQIFNDAKQKRNIIEIHIEKNETSESSSDNKSQQKYLTNDQLSDFIFKELKIKESDCIGLDYFIRKLSSEKG